MIATMNTDRIMTVENTSQTDTSNEAPTREVRVWDFPTRVFHWGLVTLIAVAWLTANAGSPILAVHIACGTAALGFIVFRVLWGVMGTRHALFSDFVRGPSETKGYARELAQGRPSYHLGHNPLGGWMVLALMVTVLAVAFSGMTVARAGFYGPLAQYTDGAWYGHLHGLLTNTLVFLIVAHVGGVVFHGLLTSENLPRAMITGNKRVGASNPAQDIRSPGVVRLTIALAIGGACMLYFLRASLM